MYTFKSGLWPSEGQKQIGFPCEWSYKKLNLSAVLETFKLCLPVIYKDLFFLGTNVCYPLFGTLPYELKSFKG